MSADPFAPVPGRHTGTTRTRESDDWEILVPVPVGAPTALGRHPKLGKPKAVWTYNDAEGRVLGYVHRYDTGPDSKEFRPLTLWRSLNGGKPEWRWVSWPPKRPLYGLDRLAARPFAPVILCEGEKASDAAGRLLPGHVAVTSANGAKSAVHADWRPLRDRVVVIWPDADAAGQAFAQAVARAIATAGARSVAIVSLPSALPVGWDAADAEAAGWTSSRAAELLVAAIPFKGEKRSARRREHDDMIGTVLGMYGL
jgi:putative DNA primase/helicase